jgi:hypothetical protein
MATAKSQLQVNLPTCEMKFSRREEYLFPYCFKWLYSPDGEVFLKLNAVNFRSKTVCSYNVLHWFGHVFYYFFVIAFKFILAVQRFSEGEWNWRPIRVNLTFEGLRLTSNPRERLVSRLHCFHNKMTECYHSRYIYIYIEFTGWHAGDILVTGLINVFPIWTQHIHSLTFLLSGKTFCHVGNFSV